MLGFDAVSALPISGLPAAGTVAMFFRKRKFKHLNEPVFWYVW